MSKPYISIKLDGQEIYVENLENPFGAQLGAFRDLAKEKLKLIREAMPDGKWTATIERQPPRPSGRSCMEAEYIVLDAETGKYLKGAVHDKETTSVGTRS